MQILDAIAFNNMVVNIKLLKTIERPASLLDPINKVLARGLYERWFDTVEDGIFDPEPPSIEYPGIAFSYWWLKVWFYANQMSLDQLNEVQAFANQEMLFIEHNLGGYGQGPVDFMPRILQHINLAIAVITSKAAYESFIEKQQINQSNAVSFEQRNTDETHDAVSDTGESLLKNYKSVQDKMDWALTLR